MSRPEAPKDSIYATPINEIAGFVFDQRVAAVFPDMISRSVPGYATIVSMIGLLAAQHASDDSNLYDLGCSLGAASAAMKMSLQHTDCHIIAVDNAPAMLEKAEAQLQDQPGVAIEFLCSDIQQVDISQASVVVLNFTLQFIPIEDRLALLKKIRRGMNEDGVLILSEKIAGATPEENALLINMHHAFKQANGYSDLEISQKRTALENVLLPETIAVHKKRLDDAGFTNVDLWFQCFNFISLVAQP